MKDFFSPAKSTYDLIEFVTNHTGLSRCNLSNRLHHEKHQNVSKQIFGFHSFEETLLYMQSFFEGIDMEFPILQHERGKIVLKPSHLTDLEQILTCKIFIKSFPSRSKCSIVTGLTRQCIAHSLDKWAPQWGTFGSCLSMLPMCHDCYAKELPTDYLENDLNKVTHLVD